MPRRRIAVALVAALSCAIGLCVVGALALAVPAARVRDEAVLHGFVDLYTPGRYEVLKPIADAADPAPYLVLGALLVLVALLRGCGRRALALVALLGLTGITTQALKHGLAEPRVVAWLNHSPSSESWPSGHATASMTLALCAVLVAPRALRWVAVVVGGLFAAVVGYALLVMHWHYASDVLGGFLVAGLWASLAAAWLARVEPLSAQPPPIPPRTWAMLAGVAAAATLGVALARQETAARYALERPSVLVAALAIGALAVALPASATRF